VIAQNINGLPFQESMMMYVQNIFHNKPQK